MNDPTRLSARDTSPFENRLLDAARNDRIPEDMALRMRQGLNLGMAATAAGHAATLFSLKAIALIVLGTATIAGLVVLGLGRNRESASGRHNVAPPTPTAPAQVVAQPVEPPAAVVETEPFVAPPARPSARAASVPSTSRSREVDLREEIALLDTARSALAAGAPRKALTVLGQYNQRYPYGTFAPEALALRIEALAGTGDLPAARALAHRFLKAHPHSPLAERVEQLTGKGP